MDNYRLALEVTGWIGLGVGAVDGSAAVPQVAGRPGAVVRVGVGFGRGRREGVTAWSARRGANRRKPRSPRRNRLKSFG